jgi:peptidyl-prolyl cis-trans isomerase A (cyclophilin A)
MTSLLLLTVALATTPSTPVTQAEAPVAKPKVTFETTKGTFVLELDPAKAPKTVANFLAYAESGFYEGTIFHRVIPSSWCRAVASPPTWRRSRPRPRWKTRRTTA